MFLVFDQKLLHDAFFTKTKNKLFSTCVQTCLKKVYLLQNNDPLCCPCTSSNSASFKFGHTKKLTNFTSFCGSCQSTFHASAHCKNCRSSLSPQLNVPSSCPCPSSSPFVCNSVLGCFEFAYFTEPWFFLWVPNLLFFSFITNDPSFHQTSNAFLILTTSACKFLWSLYDQIPPSSQKTQNLRFNAFTGHSIDWI